MTKKEQVAVILKSKLDFLGEQLSSSKLIFDTRVRRKLAGEIVFAQKIVTEILEEVKAKI